MNILTLKPKPRFYALPTSRKKGLKAITVKIPGSGICSHCKHTSQASGNLGSLLKIECPEPHPSLLNWSSLRLGLGIYTFEYKPPR